MFQNTRIKLTAWYVLIIMIISVLFSLGLYRVSSLELDRIERVNRQRMHHWMNLGLPIPEDRRLRNLLPFEDPQLITETKQRIAKQLLFINVAVLLLAGGASYLLAGRTLAPIETMVDEQKRFISDASHELKTPITALQTSLEVYLRNKKRTHKEAEEVIRESLIDVGRLHALTENLLTQASLEHNLLFTQAHVSVEQIVKQSIGSLQRLADHKSVTIVFDGIPATVSGDHQSLERLFSILIENAIKFSTSGATVTITMKRKKQTVTVSVSDTGPGIAQKDLPFIFERFYRTDLSRTHSTKGFGLGLSIAQSIANAHKAEICVTSTVGKGSTFTVLFKTLKEDI